MECILLPCHIEIGHSTVTGNLEKWVNIDDAAVKCDRALHETHLSLDGGTYAQLVNLW